MQAEGRGGGHRLPQPLMEDAASASNAKNSDPIWWALTNDNNLLIKYKNIGRAIQDSALFLWAHEYVK